MKRLLLLLAMVLAFTFTSVAQTGSSGGTGQAGQTTTSKPKAKKAKATKESTVTGCVSKEPGANGMYALTNGHYKKGVAVGPADKVKDHAGHTVQLTGQWSGTGAKKSFEVASLKHIAATCTTEGAKGAAGKSKKDVAPTK